MVEQYCKSILRIVGRNSKALANLIMGLASQPYAKSVVEISLSKCYRYQHSSINKAIDSLSKPLKKRKKKEEKEQQDNELKEAKNVSQLEVVKKFACQGRLFFKAV